MASRRHAANVAAGREDADVVLAGGRVVDVLSGRVTRADVAIAGGRVAALGDVSRCVGPRTRSVGCEGLFVLPGLIDPHVHVGFSHVTIERFAELAVRSGTVAVSTCFTESAMIAGREAVEDQLARSEGTGLDILLSPFHAAALNLLGRFSMDDLRALVEHDRCVELREWNHATSDIDGLTGVWEAALRRGRVVGGHLEGLSGAELQASVAQGVASDHEATTVQEALERARLGVVVQMRHGSSAHDLVNLLPAITEFGADPRFFSVCTDEQELHELAANGHVDHLLRMLVRNGIGPIDAVRMATSNAARGLGVEDDYGAVVPGRLASLALVEDLASFRVRHVFARGRQVVRDGRYEARPEPEPYPAAYRSTVQLERPLRPSDFALAAPDGTHRLRVIGMTPGSLRTEEGELTVPVVGGGIERSGHDLARIAVTDRHGNGGAHAVALISGLGIQRGAFAATINPGMMNLMTVGVDGTDMAVCANRAAELGGGIVVARDGAVVAEFPLPVFGVVSDAPLAESIPAAKAVASALETELGSTYPGLVPAAGFACMAASIPSLKMTDRGLVRVRRDGGRQRVDLVV